jgi:hypothetical protein
MVKIAVDNIFKVCSVDREVHATAGQEAGATVVRLIR